MTFVPQHAHDIFVSYAHVDDYPLPGASKGWVSTLVGCLKTRLAQRLGRSDAFSLWMDHELSGSEPLTPQILDKVRHSATHIAVLSPAYLASPWCKQERDVFLDFVRGQQSGRVFVVERDMIEDNERPDVFKDLRGFRFWVRERDGKSPRILGTPGPNAADYEYYSQIDDLSQEITNTLRHLKDASESSQHEAEAAEDSVSETCQTVSLAQVSDDLEFERNKVSRYLAQMGARVVPDTWYSQEPAAFGEAAKQDLEKACLYVQLLSGFPGKKPPDLPQGYLQYQLDLATAAGMPVLQWRAPELDLGSVEDSAHRAMLEGSTVRAEALEEFKREIRRQLLETPITKPRDKAVAFVFVNMDSADRPLAERVCEVLDRHNIGYALPLESRDPGEFRRDLEQNLTECDGLIVVYGESTATWVRGQLRECQKAMARRDSALRSLAVFEGPPNEKDSLGMKIPKMTILNCRNGTYEPELTKFLDELSASGDF